MSALPRGLQCPEDCIYAGALQHSELQRSTPTSHYLLLGAFFTKEFPPDSDNIPRTEEAPLLTLLTR